MVRSIGSFCGMVQYENKAASKDTMANHTHARHLCVFQSSKCPKLLKVGRSNDVDRRKQQISKLHKCNTKHCATYPYWGNLERKVHTRLCMQRSAAKTHHGDCKEWFYAPLEQILGIIEDEILKAISQPTHIHTLPLTCVQ